MAIPMPIVQDIRRLDRQGMSRAQIARRLHVDRGTVAKYADMEDCSPKPKADRRYGSKIDPYAHLVDEWLEADRLLPRKQRHTIRRVHDRLLAETDYDGEYSTTMRYVHRWREANRGVPEREGYVRLEWAAGSMQVDFGVARARIAGEMADVHCLVVSLPYVFCQVGVGRFGVSFSPCERRVSGRFGVGRSCWLLVIALVIA